MTDNVHEMWSEEELDRALDSLNANVPPGAQALAKARAELMAAAGTPLSQRRKRHWVRWTAAAVIVAALVTTLLVVPFGGEHRTASAAAEVLTSAADKIGASDPPIKPGQYLYIESHSWSMRSYNGVGTDRSEISYLAETKSQQWVPSDRKQEWLLRSAATGQRKFITGTEEEYKALDLPPHPGDIPQERKAKCGDYQVENGQQPCQKDYGWFRPTPEFLAALPTDPQRLHDKLRAETAGQGRDPDLEMLVYVADAIRTGLVPADVRANLYRALAMVPALEVSDRNANLDGRPGIGLGIDRSGIRHELIIDPATGQFIGERETATKTTGIVTAGTVMGSTSVSVGVADKMGDEPGS